MYLRDDQISNTIAIGIEMDGRGMTHSPWTSLKFLNEVNTLTVKNSATTSKGTEPNFTVITSSSPAPAPALKVDNLA